MLKKLEFIDLGTLLQIYGAMPLPPYIKREKPQKGIWSPYNDKEDYHNNVDTLNFNSTNPKLMTYHSAKGLQFETVFLPFVESADSDDLRKSLYVAMTRTYRNLYVMYSNYSMPSPLSSVPSDLYISSETDTIEEL